MRPRVTHRQIESFRGQEPTGAISRTQRRGLRRNLLYPVPIDEWTSEAIRDVKLGNRDQRRALSRSKLKRRFEFIRVMTIEDVAQPDILSEEMRLRIVGGQMALVRQKATRQNPSAARKTYADKLKRRTKANRQLSERQAGTLSAHEQLNQLYHEYRQAEQRMSMAIQTLRGAQADVEGKRHRFEAAVEFVGGSGATWTYDAEKGVVMVEAKAVTPDQAKENGAGPPTSAQIVAKATRRQIKKELGG